MARHCPLSSQAYGEVWKVCEGVDLAYIREVIKIVK
jgi:hypothetical protein